MKQPHFGMSLNPSEYAGELVKRLNFKEPYIDWVDIVLEHLGLRKQLYPGSPFFPAQQEAEIAQSEELHLPLFPHGQDCLAPPRRRQQQRPIDAALVGGTVFIDSDFPLERQRLATCHEVGHFYLPWHKGLTYVKNGCLVEPPGAKQSELDANHFAADLLMPPPFFREDMLSLPFGLESIERLSRRYLTSLEATARHYVGLSPRSCALVVVEALPHGTTAQNAAGLKVRYCHSSRSFDHFIRRGTEIAPNSLIAKASLLGPGLIIADEAPGWVLGLRPDRRLVLHCRRWGKQGDVLVLVEERQGNQGRLL